MNDDRIKKLDNLKYWYWGSKNIKKRETFDDMYKKLNNWINKYNNYPVNRKNNAEERKLKYWYISKIINKKYLSNVQIEKLEQLPKWSWQVMSINKYKFDETISKLKKWINNNNRLPKKNNNNAEEYNLWRWCCIKRKEKKKDKLSKERIIELEKIKYWYWVKK